MKKAYFLIWLLVVLATTDIVLAEEAVTYFARCNLKVLKGSYITWVNWQASPTFIPVGTELKVTITGSEATLVDTRKNITYTLDVGASGKEFLEKFVSKEKIDLKKFAQSIRENIKQAVARIGMSKEEVYIAMGPPAKVLTGDTNKMTYEEIMKHDLWIYARRRFGKNIGVSFDPENGKVNRTEGIWR